LLIGFSWRQWHKLSTQRAENAAVIFEQLLDADHAKAYDKVSSGAALLTEHFSGTPYAAMSMLLVAKEAVESNKLSKATAALSWVINSGKNKRLETIARIELARIYLSQANPIAAEKTIHGIKNKGFEPLISWIEGDIAAQKGDMASARANYMKAKEAYGEFAPADNVLTQLIAQGR